MKVYLVIGVQAVAIGDGSISAENVFFIGAFSDKKNAEYIKKSVSGYSSVKVIETTIGNELKDHLFLG